MTTGHELRHVSRCADHRGSPQPSAKQARGHRAHTDGSRQAARSSAGIDPKSAHRSYARWRARQIAYGRWEPWADAAPVRDHVRKLRGAGGSYRSIADSAGVSAMTVHKLMNGCQRNGRRQLPDRIGATHARRLLAVTQATACREWRNACGSRRRLQALVALGHPPPLLADQLGVSQSRMRRLLDGDTQRVSAAVHVSVCHLYSRLWDRVPQKQHGRGTSQVHAARTQAQEAGWPPPMALDDDKTDDPDYRPKAAWRQAHGAG